MKSKSIHNIAIWLVVITISSSLFGQIYIPGHTAIELNTTLSGLSIKNTQAGSASSLDLFNDNNRNLQIGIGNSSNLFVGEDVAYLFGPSGVSMEFYTGGFRRMMITADGKVGINSPTNFAEFLYVGGDTKIDNADLLVNDGNLFVNDGISTFFSTSSIAIQSSSTNETAIKGKSNMKHAIIGEASEFSTAGVYGVNDDDDGFGVQGESIDGFGVFGVSLNDDGVRGSSISKYGVHGISTNEYGVFGEASALGKAGVYGENTKIGTHGHGIGMGNGVLGTSLGGHGVVGKSTDNGNTKFDFYADGSSMDYGSSSSRRWKSNIQTIDNPIDKLFQLRGVYYDWDEAHGGRHDIGFIAEEVGTVIPEIVSYEKNGIDAIAMDYSKITALLAEAIKEIKREFDSVSQSQQTDIEELKRQIETLKSHSTLAEAGN